MRYFLNGLLYISLPILAMSFSVFVMRNAPRIADASERFQAQVRGPIRTILRLFWPLFRNTRNRNRTMVVALRVTFAMTFVFGILWLIGDLLEVVASPDLH